MTLKRRRTACENELERGLLDNNICKSVDAYEIAEERVKGENDDLDYLWRNSKVSWLKQRVDKRSQGRSLRKKHGQAQKEEEDQHGDEQIVAAPGKENQNPQGLE